MDCNYWCTVECVTRLRDKSPGTKVLAKRFKITVIKLKGLSNLVLNPISTYSKIFSFRRRNVFWKNWPNDRQITLKERNIPRSQIQMHTQPNPTQLDLLFFLPCTVSIQYGHRGRTLRFMWMWNSLSYDFKWILGVDLIIKL